MRYLAGLSLVEMLVSLAVLSILASVTIPYAERSYIRSKEIRLKQVLREIRVALDRFNDDCREGKFSASQEGVSENCFPTSLSVLVEGVPSNDPDGSTFYYLRRVPADPFGDETEDAEEHWEIRGYQDEPDGTWYGEDVYDVRVVHEKTAMNGSKYQEW